MRGGGLRASALSDELNAATIGGTPALQLFPASSSPRQVRFPAGHFDNSSGSSSAIQSLTSTSTLESKLELSPTESSAHRGMLEESLFPAWKNDAGGDELDSPEEMKKKDPLGTMIWKLYNRTKTQLPNSERMENLMWRFGDLQTALGTSSIALMVQPAHKVGESVQIYRCAQIMMATARPM